jgi:hypothetical protein
MVELERYSWFMKIILDSVRPVVERSRFVHIDEQAIAAFCRSVAAADLIEEPFDAETAPAPDEPEERRLAFAFVFNAINFCYWGEPKWRVELNGRTHDGCAAMMRAIVNAPRLDVDLLEPRVLAELTAEQLAAVLRGNVVIPLFEERLKLLRLLGQGILEKFGGSFGEVIARSGGTAAGLVALLVKEFPEVFNDVETYHGYEVSFYKRAQLVPAHLISMAKTGLVSARLSGHEELTAFADYKIPQLLRKFGILVYVTDLAARIDSLTELPCGSDEEIEIRANTVWAVELMSHALHDRFPTIDSATVDVALWHCGQVKSPDDKPYHRTRTIWY